MNALSVINHSDRMVRKASDVLAADWQYQTRKIIRRFAQSCTGTAFHSAGNRCKNLQLV